MADTPAPTPCVGVFDSGVGGLSVLRALHRRLPDAHLHYVADSAYAPYGDRAADEVIARCGHITEHLLERGARMVVVACNTATTLAIRSLRERWPQIPFVGVEPGIKPAVATTRNGRIGIMATRRTIGSDRLRSLVEDHASACSVVLQPCPGLADAIETGRLDDGQMLGMIQSYCQPLMDAGVDTVVLGCTHYPFVAPVIQSILGPQVTLIDTADAVAQRAQTVWKAAGVPAGANGLTLETTGDPVVLASLALRGLGVHAPAQRVRIGD